MSLRINTNIAAMTAHRNLSMTDAKLTKSLERLSSGFRINRAADDSAGLAISEKMRGQINGLDQASQNAQDAISLLNTAEGNLNESESILQRMRTLAVQAASDTLTTSDRSEIQTEMNQLSLELSRIANTSEFNTRKLLNGDISGGITLQIGANAGQIMTVGINDMSANSLYLASPTVGNAALASTTIASIDAAIYKVSNERSRIGAYVNRLEHTINFLGIASENLSASESRIRDLDMAKEVTEMARNQILMQSGISMLAQANQSTKLILSLLQ